MMQILKDSQVRPELYIWEGPLEQEQLEQWNPPNQIDIPSDLKELWLATGGGEFFETETLLSPIVSDAEYDVTATNQFYWNSGIDKSLLIFHVGSWVSAVRSTEPRYLILPISGGEPKKFFASIEDWYCQGLRKEYAVRYGLVEE